jgi:hypothetical protein
MDEMAHAYKVRLDKIEAMAAGARDALSENRVDVADKLLAKILEAVKGRRFTDRVGRFPNADQA